MTFAIIERRLSERSKRASAWAWAAALIGLSVIAIAGLAAAQPLPANTQACFPTCRTGYTCNAGKCVRSCPPCASGQRCGASGECVSACEPACAVGEICGAAGQCVSACNPSCAVNERCGANGECVSKCNPACTDGQTCSESGECVSACDPACYPGERCASDGICYLISSPAPAPAPAPQALSTQQANPPPPAADLPAADAVQPMAAPQPGPARSPAPGSNQVWGELTSFANSENFGPTYGDAAVGSVALAARARLFVAEHFLVQAGLPLVSVFAKTGDGIRLANPSGSFSYVFELGHRTHAFAGVGLTLPFAHVPKLPGMSTDQAAYDEAVTAQITAERAYSFGAAMRGYSSRWEYLGDFFSVYFPMEIETGTKRLRFAGQLTLAHMFYVGSIATTHSVTPLDVGARIQAYLSSNVSLGARLRMAFLLSSADDHLQTSLEPFFELVAGSYLLGLGLLVNLDTPAGPSSDLFVWALRINFGKQF